MYLTGLSLQSFRNYSSRVFKFSPRITLILAPNATGKSNLLEAIHLLATGESFRAGKIDDVIQVGAEFGRIKTKITDSRHSRESGNLRSEILKQVQDDAAPGRGDESNELELLLTRGQVGGRRTQKKIFSLNGVKKQMRSLIGM